MGFRRRQVAWRRQLPPHLQHDSRESCREYRRRPRLQPFHRLLETDAALILASRSGVLALRRQDGAVLLDAAAASATTFLFDDGTFSLEGGSPCTGRSPTVFAFCDPHNLLFFNGLEGVLIDTRTWRLEARGKVSDVKSVDGRPSLREARVRARYAHVDVARGDLHALMTGGSDCPPRAAPAQGGVPVWFSWGTPKA